MANKKLRIKELSQEHGIKLSELASRLGISPTSFSQALSRNKFGIDRLSEIADIFGVEIPDLFESGYRYKVTCPHCGKEIRIELK